MISGNGVVRRRSNLANDLKPTFLRRSIFRSEVLTPTYLPDEVVSTYRFNTYVENGASDIRMFVRLDFTVATIEQYCDSGNEVTSTRSTLPGNQQPDSRPEAIMCHWLSTSP